MNIPLFEQVIKLIGRKPKSFDMDWWHKAADGTDLDDDKWRCGTTHCIAGYVQFIVGIDGLPSAVARDALQINDDQKWTLFYLNAWPEWYSRRYLSAKTHSARAKVAIQRIRRFIRTNGKD